MNFVELGHIARPHGFKGEFVVKSLAGDVSALHYLKIIYIGKTPENAKPFPVLEAAWMPSGWKIKVEGLTSDEEVKNLRGHLLFAPRESLAAPAENEYYVIDLEGAKVMDSETQKEFGTFVNAEKVAIKGKNFGQDRWWIQTGKGQISIPAVKHYIQKVDTVNRVIWLKNLNELSEKE